MSEYMHDYGKHIKEQFARRPYSTVTDYPERTWKVRRHIAAGITEAAKGYEVWPDWASVMLAANDMVMVDLTTTTYAHDLVNGDGIHYVAVCATEWNDAWYLDRKIKDSHDFNKRGALIRILEIVRG